MAKFARLTRAVLAGSRGLFMVLLILPTQAIAQDASDMTDAELIQQTVFETLTESDSDKAALTTVDDPLIVRDHAIATWLLGEAGGMMILEQQSPDEWVIICGDGGLLDAAAMVSYCGMSQGDADALWSAWLAADALN
ncbi:MAG: hypothetical protein AAGE59_37740 [Cyanobacteria bacterium P01_F01_bin.86]